MGLCFINCVEFFFQLVFNYTQRQVDIFTIKITRIEEIEIEFPVKGFISLLLVIFLFIYTFYFPHFINYMVFYSIIVLFIYINSLFLSHFVEDRYQPFKRFLFIMAGVINFVISKFHNNIVRFPKSEYEVMNYESFQMVSDLFTVTCLSFTPSYLLFQMAEIFEKKEYMTNNQTKSKNEIFMDNIEDEKREDSNYRVRFKNYNDKLVNFTIDNVEWIGLFIFELGLLYVSLLQRNYIIFYFGIFYLLINTHIFSLKYSSQVSRVLYGYSIFVCLILNQVMSTKTDNYLFKVNNIYK